MKHLLAKLLMAVLLVSMTNINSSLIAVESKQSAKNLRDNCENCLRLVPSKKSNEQRNLNGQKKYKYTYWLEVYSQGELIDEFEIATGKVGTQDQKQYNRHEPNKAAPLPDGKYTVKTNKEKGDKPEVGKFFFRVTPHFPTRRTDLGIHVDPSYGKTDSDKKNQAHREAGTSGCIGFAKREEFNKLVALLEEKEKQGFKQYLIVDIGEGKSTNGRVNTTNNPLNMRSGPGKNSPVIGTIPKGKSVAIYQGDNNSKDWKDTKWYEVNYNGKIGWVSADYVEVFYD